MLFAVTLFFCPSSFLSLIYTGVGLLLSLFYWCVYWIKIKNGTMKKQNHELDYSIVVISLMIVSINLVSKIEFVNLVFGFFLVLTFFAYILKLSFSKKKENNRLFEKVNLFDFYTIIYLVGLIMKLMLHEF
jgi:hypothetical protein